LNVSYHVEIAFLSESDSRSKHLYIHANERSIREKRLHHIHTVSTDTAKCNRTFISLDRYDQTQMH